MTFFVTKSIEFDAGHRVPEHESKCRNPHGHRYKVEVMVGARELEHAGPSAGMVLDFGHIKTVLMKKVHDVLDHGFIVYERDDELLECFFDIHYSGIDPDPSQRSLTQLRGEPDWNIIIFPYVPTAENIARWVFEEIEDDIKAIASQYHSVWLDGVVVWETSTSKAIYNGPYAVHGPTP